MIKYKLLISQSFLYFLFILLLLLSLFFYYTLRIFFQTLLLLDKQLLNLRFFGYIYRTKPVIVHWMGIYCRNIFENVFNDLLIISDGCVVEDCIALEIQLSVVIEILSFQFNPFHEQIVLIRNQESNQTVLDGDSVMFFSR